MTQPILMTVSLHVRPQAQAAFNDFYHHDYLPALMQHCPEFASARRYEEFGTQGSLTWFSKRCWTVYELAEGLSTEAIEAALNRPGREKQRQRWMGFAREDVTGIERILWQETYRHPRVTWDGDWGSRPFFTVMVETESDPQQAQAFRHWYESVYLPKIMADVPTWAAVRRYTSVNRPTQRQITIYETNDTASLERSFELMRSPWRYESNGDWDQWVGNAITWQDATSFQPIFRWPG